MFHIITSSCRLEMMDVGPSRGGLLGVKTPFFLAMKIRAPLEGPFRGLFGTGPTFTVRGPENELGAPKVQKRATLRPPSACYEGSNCPFVGCA